MIDKLEALKPCPFCGGSASVGISDDEGNPRDEKYENNPWSGLSFTILHGHDNNKECPIANHDEDGATVGILLYESREEAVQAWNKRLN